MPAHGALTESRNSTLIAAWSEITLGRQEPTPARAGYAGKIMQRVQIGKRPSGRNAAALKYDLLTALGAHACAGDKHLQRLTLRLITLIVARYNWITGEIAVGQREIAGLWSIDERSVKREMGRMRELGWLVVKHSSARGRVAVHRLDIDRILSQTERSWPCVGPDFVARMAGPEAPAPAGNVISFPAPQGDGDVWARIQVRLHREDPNLYNAWFVAVRSENSQDSTLHLVAPSRFHADYLRTNFLHRLERLARELDPGIERVTIITA